MRKQILTGFVAAFAVLIGGSAARAQFSNAVMALNPIGYWPLDETTAPPGSKPAAVNSGSLGTADNGTYTDGAFPGVAGALAGDSDTAGFFSGATGFNPMMSAPYDTNYAKVSQFTVEFWVNTPQDPGFIYTKTCAPTWPCPVNCVDPASPTAGWLVYEGYNGNSGVFDFITYNTNGTTPSLDLTMKVPPAYVDSNGNILSNIWLYVAVSFDGTNATGYIDGQPVATGKASGYVASTAGGFTVGNVSGGGNALAGLMDEVAYYSNVLSASDILARYQAGTNPAPATPYHTLVANDHPLLYYRLDDGPALVAANYGTLGAFLDGYYESGIVPGAAGPDYPGFGPTSYACQFLGGNNAGVSILNAAGLLNLGDLGQAVPTPIQSVSLAAWVQVPAGGIASFETVLGTGDCNYRMSEDTSGDPHFAMANQDATGSAAVNDGLWHLWVGVWDASSGNDYLYIDGQLAATGSPNSGGLQGEPLLIGGAPDYNGRDFVGSLAHVALFDYALSSSQVASLASAAEIPPSITLNPADSFCNAGAVVTLASGASGSEPLVYQWYAGTPASGRALSNGNRVSGANGPTLVINPVAGTDASSYFLLVTNGGGQATSSVVTVTVPTAPTARVFAGRSPTFQVTPGATNPFTYQWETNGVVDTTATGNTYTLSHVSSANNAETVECVITDASFAGPVNSSLYTLQVVPAPADPYALAVLADNPIAYFRLDEENVSGDNGTGNDGKAAWDYVSGQNGVYSNVVLEATGFQTPGRPADGDGSAVFGTNTLGSPSFAGFIPISFSVAVSNSPAQPGNAEFSVEAWVNGGQQKNHGIVTKGYGQDGQNGAPYGEQFTLQTSLGGGNFGFDVTTAKTNAVGIFAGNDGVNWHHLVGVCDQANGHTYLYRDGVLMATGNITPGEGLLSSIVPVSIGAKQVTDTSGNYSGQFAGTIDEVAIYATALNVTQVMNHYFAAGIVPTITTEPLAAFSPSYITNANEGSTVGLTVTAFGTPTLYYQWYSFGNNVGAGTNLLAGATAATLVIPAAESTTNYFVIVTNTFGAVTSIVAQVNAVPGPPQISPDLPATNYAIAGGTGVFTLGENGSVPFTNAWYFGTALLTNGGRFSGAQSTTLTISDVQMTDAGSYQMWATNAHGTGSSSPSTLVVLNEPTVSATANPTAIGWTSAGNGVYTASAAGGVITVTSAENGQVNTFFLNQPMNIQAFKATFTYQDVTGTPSDNPYQADGITFCLQNDPRGVTAASGGGGNLLNYSGSAGVGIAPSAAIGIELFPQIGSTGWQFLTNGETATFFIGTGSVNLSGGDPINWTILYNGNSITLMMEDVTTSGIYSTQFVVGALSEVVGGDTALVGFTGSTGGYNADQVISNFVFTPLPEIATTRSEAGVVLSWATEIGGYVLEKNSSLTNPSGWTTIPGPYNIVNGENQLAVSPLTGTVFYRLVVAP